MIAVVVALASVQAAPIKLTVDGQARIAIIENDRKTLQPAVIVLHGGMGSAELMQRTSGFGPVARANKFMVVYPQGTDFGNGRHAWNTGHLLRRQVQGANDVQFLDDLIDRLVKDHHADPKRIYITGGSNGGMMTLVYATQRAAKIAAIAPVVAAMFSLETRPDRPVPALFVQGAKDDEVPIEGGMSRNPLVRNAQNTPYQPFEATLKFWVDVNRSDPNPKTVVDGTVTTRTFSPKEGGAPTLAIVDAEGGHGWPGRPARRAGTTPIAVPDIAARIWQFFQDQVRP